MQLLASALDRYVAGGRTDDWYEFPIRDVAQQTNLAVIETTEEEWAEVDRPEDIPKAERLIRRLIGP